MTSTDSNVDDEWERERAAEEADRVRKQEPKPALAEAEFLAWRSPRRGDTNPTRLDNLLWSWLVRTGWSAYRANEMFFGPSSFGAGPMWTFERFGMSETALPDGRIVYIAGEHEDYYDPDFFIYNDITVVDKAGGISVYGYPEHEFPPTDFHSATLVGQSVFIIGRLGYSSAREPGSTPVYKLSLDSMRVEQVHTHGEPPGWIYRHSATLSDDGSTIRVTGGERWLGNARAPAENIDVWLFSTHTGEWRRLTQHLWQRWTMRRADRKSNRIRDTRQALWHRDNAYLGLERYWSFDTEPDLAALEMLYRIDESSPVPVAGSEHGTYSVVVDGLTVRFNEHRFWVEAIVEGQLTQDRLSKLQKLTLALLARIDTAPYVIEGPDDDAKLA